MTAAKIAARLAGGLALELDGLRRGVDPDAWRRHCETMADAQIQPSNTALRGIYYTKLPDGTVGYYIRPGVQFDCWHAAICTVIQVPVDQFPRIPIAHHLAAGIDPQQVNKEWYRTIRAWLRDRGWRMLTHQTPPWGKPRWIGATKASRAFHAHALVMAGDRPIFDPAGMYRAHLFDAADIEFGYSLQRLRKD